MEDFFLIIFLIHYKNINPNLPTVEGYKQYNFKCTRLCNYVYRAVGGDLDLPVF